MRRLGAHPLGPFERRLRRRHGRRGHRAGGVRKRPPPVPVLPRRRIPQLVRLPLRRRIQQASPRQGGDVPLPGRRHTERPPVTLWWPAAPARRRLPLRTRRPPLPRASAVARAPAGPFSRLRCAAAGLVEGQDVRGRSLWWHGCTSRHLHHGRRAVPWLPRPLLVAAVLAVALALPLTVLFARAVSGRRRRRAAGAIPARARGGAAAGLGHPQLALPAAPYALSFRRDLHVLR
mmetsp:Transcript_12674/g.35779  ORF Transcript_12674/g.35779 Transcript_12674/m.35779 type:complete len:233 (-) Transcript_12674:432-1130(-)